jgi:hypothetical protein
MLRTAELETQVQELSAAQQSQRGILRFLGWPLRTWVGQKSENLRYHGLQVSVITCVLFEEGY